MYKILFYFVLVVLIIPIQMSCNDDRIKLEAILEEFPSIQNNNKIYIFYGLSCRSCTVQISKYVLKCLSNPSCSDHFIFTDSGSVKEINHVFGLISDDPRVIIDLKKCFYPLRYSRHYTFPIRVTVNNHEIMEVKSLDIEYFSKNSVF